MSFAFAMYHSSRRLTLNISVQKGNFNFDCSNVSYQSYHIVSQGGHQKFALKSLDKKEMIERNKVMRVLNEHQVLNTADHPFVATLYTTIQTKNHIHFLLEYYEGGELYALLNNQAKKRFREEVAKFYIVEIILAIQ